MRIFQQRFLVAILSALLLLDTACSLPDDTTEIDHATGATPTAQKTVWYGEKQITYYTQGPANGPILIFLHGWPAIAETWRPQIDYFSQLGFFVVAPDMPGFGRSTARKVASDYAHENIVAGLLAMLADTGRQSAVWICHDWGAGVGSSIAAVHPEVVDAMVWLAVPYKTLELGYEYMLQFVNRTVYPEPTFHYAQWDYQKYYNTNFDRATGVFETDYEYSTKSVYVSSGGRNIIGNRSSTAYLTASNGRFCGVDSLPPPANISCLPGLTPPAPSIPLNKTVLNQDLYDSVIAALRNTTYTPPNLYYVNQQANKDYNVNNQKNNGHLKIPCLFIQADYDLALNTIDSTLLSPMPAHCENFSFARFPTGHWVALEDANGTNMAISSWLAANVTSYKPNASMWDNVVLPGHYEYSF